MDIKVVAEVAESAERDTVIKNTSPEKTRTQHATHLSSQIKNQKSSIVIHQSIPLSLRPSDPPTLRPSDPQTFRLSDFQTFRPSDLQTFRPSDLPTFRPSDSKKKSSRPPVSRILSASVHLKLDDHFSQPSSRQAPRSREVRLLPGIFNGRAALSLFCLAPPGVYIATSVTLRAVGSYPTISTLPVPFQAIGGLFSAALSVRTS